MRNPGPNEYPNKRSQQRLLTKTPSRTSCGRRAHTATLTEREWRGDNVTHYGVRCDPPTWRTTRTQKDARNTSDAGHSLPGSFVRPTSLQPPNTNTLMTQWFYQSIAINWKFISTVMLTIVIMLACYPSCPHSANRDTAHRRLPRRFGTDQEEHDYYRRLALRQRRFIKAGSKVRINHHFTPTEVLSKLNPWSRSKKKRWVGTIVERSCDLGNMWEVQFYHDRFARICVECNELTRHTPQKCTVCDKHWFKKLTYRIDALYFAKP